MSFILPWLWLLLADEDEVVEDEAADEEVADDGVGSVFIVDDVGISSLDFFSGGTSNFPKIGLKECNQDVCTFSRMFTLGIRNNLLLFIENIQGFDLKLHIS